MALLNLSVTISAPSGGQSGAKVKSGIAAGFAAVAPKLLADMRSRTPVNTGALRDSETVTADGTTLTLYAGTDHALYQEVGTRYITARRFMMGTIEADLPLIQQAILDGIEQSSG